MFNARPADSLYKFIRRFGEKASSLLGVFAPRIITGVMPRARRPTLDGFGLYYPCPSLAMRGEDDVCAMRATASRNCVCRWHRHRQVEVERVAVEIRLGWILSRRGNARERHERMEMLTNF